MVRDGVVGADVESGETAELSQGPGEPVLHDVGVGRVSVREA